MKHHFSSQEDCINLINLHSRVLLWKLIAPHQVKKFWSFYGTRRFIITAFTRACCLSPSWVRWIQPVPCQLTFLRSQLIERAVVIISFTCWPCYLWYVLASARPSSRKSFMYNTGKLLLLLLVYHTYVNNGICSTLLW